jgi:hypothetical protein
MSSTAIKFKSTVKKLEHLSGYYLDVPATVVKKIGGISKQRWVCNVDKLAWQCGIVAHKVGGGYILLNQRLMKQGALKEGSTVAVQLKKDESQFGLAMPAELAEVLSQDSEGKARFKALVPGKSRYIIYYVNQVKSSTLRIERAVRCINNLKKLPKGKESFAGILAK